MTQRRVEITLHTLAHFRLYRLIQFREIKFRQTKIQAHIFVRDDQRRIISIDKGWLDFRLFFILVLGHSPFLN